MNLIQTHATEPLLECVPNFSEGRNTATIDAIAAAIRAVSGVRLLEVDAGYAANRTVMTFAGRPEAVAEAAFQAMKCAQRLIDMAQHQGEHPRFGATDVCPLVPLANVGMEEAVALAHALAERVGKELGYPVYCYEAAAKRPHFRNLAAVRAGQYEALPDRLREPSQAPDYGPAAFHARSGASAIGARALLVAYNVNLATADARIASAIAREIRESGFRKRLPDGSWTQVPGLLPGVKAIGWHIREFGCAQVSMNLVDPASTPMHVAFEAVKMLARKHGTEVTGSELVGLVPLSQLLRAGRHFLPQAKSEEELVATAIHRLHLNDVKPFSPQYKILEYLLA
jgi:glutamate formiminotransferase/formiminotetrahydrofolate cyclodeaminase